MPFDDDEEVVATRPGLKINNKTSSVKSTLPAKAEFDKKAEEVFNRSEDFKRRAGECARAYVQILKDKTLVENKDSITKDMEKEIRQNLIQLGTDMNNDELQDEAAGAMGLIALMLNVITMQRDRLNEIHFKMTKIEQMLKDSTKG